MCSRGLACNRCSTGTILRAGQEMDATSPSATTPTVLPSAFPAPHPPCPFSSLPLEIIEVICAFFPFSPRVRIVARVSKQFRHAALRSVTTFPWPIQAEHVKFISSLYPAITSLSVNVFRAPFYALPFTIRCLSLSGTAPPDFWREAITSVHSLTELSITIDHQWRIPLPHTLRKLSLSIVMKSTQITDHLELAKCMAYLPHLESLGRVYITPATEPLFIELLTSVASQLTDLSLSSPLQPAVRQLQLPKLKSLRMSLTSHPSADDFAFLTSIANRLTHLHILTPTSMLPHALMEHVTTMYVSLVGTKASAFVSLLGSNPRRLSELGPAQTLSFATCQVLGRIRELLTHAGMDSYNSGPVLRTYKDWPLVRLFRWCLGNPLRLT